MTQSEKIKTQIFKDFSLDNFNNLFKGERNSWYLIDSSKKRKSLLELQDGEYKYCLSYDGIYENLWIGGYKHILEPMDALQVLGLIRQLDNEYYKLSRQRMEKEKNDFISRTFSNL